MISDEDYIQTLADICEHFGVPFAASAGHPSAVTKWLVNNVSLNSVLSKKVQASEPVAEEIADAVLAWMVRFDLLDAGNEYRAEDVVSVLNDLAPTTPQPLPAADGGAQACREHEWSSFQAWWESSGHAADPTFTLTMENCAFAAWQARAALSVPAPGTGGAEGTHELLTKLWAVARQIDPSPREDIASIIVALRAALSPSTPVGEGKQP